MNRVSEVMRVLVAVGLVAGAAWVGLKDLEGDRAPVRVATQIGSPLETPLARVEI